MRHIVDCRTGRVEVDPKPVEVEEWVEVEPEPDPRDARIDALEAQVAQLLAALQQDA